MIDVLDDVAIYFVSHLRNARANALRDAEAYHDIVIAVEQLGSFLSEGKVKGIAGMGAYSTVVNELAQRSVLARDIPNQYSALHSVFSELYQSVRYARNDAVHQGAYARHLTNHAILLALVLEDALMTQLSRVADYMVRDPICAAPWQPISLVRQQMLLNSFSFLPVQLELKGETCWYLISDSAVASFLRIGEGKSQRLERIAQTVRQAVLNDHLKAEPAFLVQVDDKIDDVLKKYSGQPLLVVDDQQRLAGILTAFDLL